MEKNPSVWHPSGRVGWCFRCQDLKRNNNNVNKTRHTKTQATVTCLKEWISSLDSKPKEMEIYELLDKEFKFTDQWINWDPQIDSYIKSGKWCMNKWYQQRDKNHERKNQTEILERKNSILNWKVH